MTKNHIRTVIGALGVSALLATGAACSSTDTGKTVAAAEAPSRDGGTSERDGALALLKASWLTIESDSRRTLCDSYQSLDHDEFYVMFTTFVDNEYMNKLTRSDVLGFFADQC